MLGEDLVLFVPGEKQLDGSDDCLLCIFGAGVVTLDLMVLEMSLEVDYDPVELGL